MYAIQGAMAIRRQRQMRENRRMSQIRMSTKSGRKGSASPRASDAGSNAEAATSIPQIKGPPKAETSQTAFYLGVVFILLGFLMIFSSMISSSATDTDWSRLLGVGVTFLLVGLIMVMVNRIITAREEEELTRYVSHRLGRSRSGHTLVRDAESGEDFHHHLQRTSRQPSKPRSPRPQKSPRDKPVEPFPKFSKGSQVSTRVGSTRTSPITPGPKSLSLHSNLGSSNHHHVQNGKPHPQVEQEAIPAVVVEETIEETCPKSVSKEKLNSSNVPETSNNIEESTENNGNCGGETTFSSEVISETETLLKSSKSMTKPKAKKNSSNALS